MRHQSESDVLKIFRRLEYILFFFPTPGQLRALGFTSTVPESRMVSLMLWAGIRRGGKATSRLSMYILKEG